MSFRQGSYEKYLKSEQEKTVKLPKSEQAEFQILDAGTHAAVCTWVVGIGMQETTWEGVTKEVEKLKLRFEVPSERVSWVTKDGAQEEGPMVIWLTVTASMHKNSRLRRIVQGWLGVKFDDKEAYEFDTDALIGRPCLISVVHREYQDKTYANIDTISPLMKGMAAPVPEGELLSFDPYHHTPEEFAKLPSWLQELVNKGLSLRNEQRARAETGIGMVKEAFDKLVAGETKAVNKMVNPDDDDIPF